MAKTILVVALLTLTWSSAAAQTDDEALRQAEKGWNAAIAAADATSAQTFMADDYILVGTTSAGASSVDRDTWLKNLAGMTIKSYQTEVTRKRVYGNAAVVSLKGGWHVLFHGHEIDVNFFLTDVWTKGPDGWKVVLRHSSSYPRS